MCPSDSRDISAKTIVLHELDIADVEDPYLYAAFPISDWQRTDKGSWCMQHVTEEPVFTCCPHNYGYRVTITGKLLPEDVTFFCLKWGDG